MKNIRRSALIGALILQAPASFGAVNFIFNYTDVGVGFNDPTEGAARRAGLEEAASRVAAIFSAYNADVHIDVDGSQTNDTTLASAGSNFNFTPSGPGFDGRGDVGIKILGGVDPSPGTADGKVDWNFEDFMWEAGDDFQPGEMDLISTAMHELLHAVGVSSDITQSGINGYGTSPGNPAIWAPFDQFVGDGTGALIDGSFALDGSRWNTASVGGTGTSPAGAGLYFYGANAMALNGGNPVPLYSPTAWVDGSSGSHLDTDFFTGANAKMMNHEATVAEGLDLRDIDALTVAMLQDMGFTEASLVPEPASTALLGLGGIALLIRRRRA
ncbi:hypothetical protein NT6N_23200 [Oceaniferula spumae]|uniref:Ice-binding protein C-terminal domain-containing protein n=1 Tax=Oceaniferula spumae TaxID=2979115 RepID=A0AAT9FMU9_9BACT